MKRNLEYIEWEDSYGCSSRWSEIDDAADPGIMICRSVGWVVRESKKLIVIVPHLANLDGEENEQGCGDMTIPTASILRRVALPVPDKIGQS